MTHVYKYWAIIGRFQGQKSRWEAHFPALESFVKPFYSESAARHLGAYGSEIAITCYYCSEPANGAAGQREHKQCSRGNQIQFKATVLELSKSC